MFDTLTGWGWGLNQLRKIGLLSRSEIFKNKKRCMRWVKKIRK
nr:MAG TPA: hypothetical protein [Bacteriophage sp.]